jgi:uroporphyrinogen-III synthase
MRANNIEILCTRQLQQHVIATVIENGITIDCVPFIKSELITTNEIVETINALANKKITAIFTSTNAVEAVIQRLSAKPDWDIFCIGGITKETAIGFFGEEAIKGTARDAKVLAEKIIAGNNNELVFFCGDQHLDDLPQIVKKHSLQLNEIIVYNTIYTPHVINKNYDGILFFSPSAVHSFFIENTIVTDVILFAIGKTTADAIGTYVSNEIVTSDWPRQEQLVEKLIGYFKTMKQENRS